jgi:voltage-gated potassium channel
VAVTGDRLRAIPLFSTLSDDELEATARLFEEREVPPGKCLTVEGASGYCFFVIENGAAEVEQDGRVVNTLGAGDFFGEMAIISGERRSATVRAVSPLDLLVLFGTEFRVLERDLPSVAQKFAETMGERRAPSAHAG